MGQYDECSMRSAVYHGPEDIRIESRDPKPLKSNSVRIDVEYCGICGSDVHEYTAGPLAIPSETPHPLTDAVAPVPLGHEFSGLVAECGEDVTSFAPGDRVTVNPALWCGECRYCQDGHYQRCVHGGSIGLSGAPGGFAETAVLQESMVVPLPERVSLKHGALVEPYSVALHAIRRSGFKPGDAIAVFGAGPIGLCIVDIASNAGATDIFVSEPRAIRRENARQIGATETLDPQESSPIHHISAETDGGVEIAFESAGVAETVNQAVRSTLKGGTVTLISVFEESISVQPNFVMMAERSITGSIAYQTGPRARDGEFGVITEMLARDSLTPDALITSEIELEDIVANGFEQLIGPNSDQIKVLVSP